MSEGNAGAQRRGADRAGSAMRTWLRIGTLTVVAAGVAALGVSAVSHGTDSPGAHATPPPPRAGSALQLVRCTSCADLLAGLRDHATANAAQLESVAADGVGMPKAAAGAAAPAGAAPVPAGAPTERPHRSTRRRRTTRRALMSRTSSRPTAAASSRCRTVCCAWSTRRPGNVERASQVGDGNGHRQISRISRPARTGAITAHAAETRRPVQDVPRHSPPGAP